MGYREVYAGLEGGSRRASGCRRPAAIDWIRPPSRALDASRAPLYGWFADAVCNTC